MAFKSLTIVVGVLLGCSLVAWFMDPRKSAANGDADTKLVSDGRLTLEGRHDAATRSRRWAAVGNVPLRLSYAQRGPDHVWFYHAENQYLEARRGGAGLDTSPSHGRIACCRLALNHRMPQRSRSASRLLALTSQAVHSIISPHMPANTLLPLIVVRYAPIGPLAHPPIAAVASDVSRAKSIQACLPGDVCLLRYSDRWYVVASVITVAVVMGCGDSQGCGH
jgi:hypothetical protein